MRNHYWVIAVILTFVCAFAAGLFTESAVANDSVFTDGNTAQKDNSDKSKILKIKMESEDNTYENVQKKLINLYDQKIDKSDSTVINVIPDNFYNFMVRVTQTPPTRSEKESTLLAFINDRDETSPSIDVFYSFWNSMGQFLYSDATKETDTIKNIDKYWSTFYFLEKITKYKSCEFVFDEYKIFNNGTSVWSDILFSGYVKSTTFIQII